MLEKARARSLYDDLTEADAAQWQPKAAPALIFSNAALQWLPDHPALFPKLLRAQTDFMVQAMACGLPVISTPVGSIAEIVSDGEGISLSKRRITLSTWAISGAIRDMIFWVEAWAVDTSRRGPRGVMRGVRTSWPV